MNPWVRRAIVSYVVPRAIQAGRRAWQRRQAAQTRRPVGTRIRRR